MSIGKKSLHDQSEALGASAMDAFNKAHGTLVYAAQLAEAHAAEHEARVAESTKAAFAARSLASTQRRRADKIADLLCLKPED